MKIGTSVLSLLITFPLSAKSICDGDRTRVQTRLRTEMKNGLPTRVVAFIADGETVRPVKTYVARIDLWDGGFKVSGSDGDFKVAKEADLLNRICKAFDFNPPSGSGSKGAKLLVAINPNSSEGVKVLEEWAKRNAGIYRNMGFRMDWDALKDVRKSENLLLEMDWSSN